MDVILLKHRLRRAIQRILPLPHQRGRQSPISHDSLKHVIDPVVQVEEGQVDLALWGQQAGRPQVHQQFLGHGTVDRPEVGGGESDVVPKDEANLALTQRALCLGNGRRRRKNSVSE